MVSFLHYLYWSVIFLNGVFQILDFPSYLYKVSFPLICSLLFLIQLAKKKEKLRLPFIKWFIGIITIALISVLINRIDMFSFIYFLVYIIFSYLYFIIIINESNNHRIKKIRNYVIFLILLQIPVSIIKYLIIGQTESGAIGTMATEAGSLSTMFPLFIISFLTPLFLIRKKILYLILILFFIAFGIIGHKRVLVYFVPLLFIIAYFITYYIINRKLSKRHIRNLFIIILISILSFYSIARLDPTLNPDHTIGGRFDLDYLLSYSDEYAFSESNDLKEMSRFEGLLYFSKYLIHKEPITFLFGEGAGKLIKSQYRETEGDMLANYGVRYGGRMGFIWLLLQVGFLGVFLYIGLLIKLNLFLFKKYKLIGYLNNPILIGFIIATIFMLIDIFIYSSVSIKMEVLKGTYFFVAALLYRELIIKSSKYLLN